MQRTLEIIEVLDEASWRYFRDPEFLDVLLNFRERISSKNDKNEHYEIVGEYIEFLRREFRDNPERFNTDYKTNSISENK